MDWGGLATQYKIEKVGGYFCGYRISAYYGR